MQELLEWLQGKMALVMDDSDVGTMDALARAQRELSYQNHNVRIMQFLVNVISMRDHAALNLENIKYMATQAMIEQTKIAMEQETTTRLARPLPGWHCKACRTSWGIHGATPIDGICCGLNSL